MLLFVEPWLPAGSVPAIYYMLSFNATSYFQCPVETCSRSFTEAYKLKSHVESHSALYKCQDCDVACSTVKALQNHKIKAHSRKLFK